MKTELKRILAFGVVAAIASALPAMAALKIVGATVTLTGQGWRYIVNEGDPEPYPEYTYRAENIILICEGEQGVEDPEIEEHITYTWTYDGATLVNGGTPPGGKGSEENGDDFVTIRFEPGMDEDITVTVHIDVTTNIGDASTSDSMVVAVADVDLNGWVPDPETGGLTVVPQNEEDAPGVLLEFGDTKLTVEDLHVEEGQFTLTFDGTKISLDGDSSGQIVINCGNPAVTFPQWFDVTPGSEPQTGFVVTQVLLTHSLQVRTDTVTLVIPKVEIKQDGNVITNTTHDEVIGKPINLVAEVLPTGLSIESRLWSIPPTVVADYEATVEEGVVTLVTDEDQQQDAVQFYWVNRGEPREVVHTVVIGGATFSGRATFNVKGVDSQFQLDDPLGNIEVSKKYDGGVYRLHFGLESYWADILGLPDVPGVVFSHSATYATGFPGEVKCRQMITSLTKSRQLDPGDGTQGEWKTGSGTGFLDGYLFMPDNEDSPRSEFLQFVYMGYERNTTFVTWLMFRPSVANAIWVPLRKIEWFWSAKVRRDPFGAGYKWTITNSSKPSPVPGNQETTDFPQWTERLPHDEPEYP